MEVAQQLPRGGGLTAVILQLEIVSDLSIESHTAGRLPIYTAVRVCLKVLDVMQQQGEHVEGG